MPETRGATARHLLCHRTRIFAWRWVPAAKHCCVGSPRRCAAASATQALGVRTRRSNYAEVLLTRARENGRLQELEAQRHTSYLRQTGVHGAQVRHKTRMRAPPRGDGLPVACQGLPFCLRPNGPLSPGGRRCVAACQMAEGLDRVPPGISRPVAICASG